MYAADLDALVMLKPWTDDGRERYARALAVGMAAFPMIEWMFVPRGMPLSRLRWTSARLCRGSGQPFIVQYTRGDTESPRAQFFERPDDSRLEEMGLVFDRRDSLSEYRENKKAEAHE